MVLSMTLALTACGFQLRGSMDISKDIAPLYVEQNSVFELGRELKSLMATNGIEVAKNVAAANTMLILHDESKASRVLSVDGNGQAREYELTYKVNFSIVLNDQLNDNKAAMSPVETSDKGQAEQPYKVDSISLHRTLLFQQDAVLAVANETEVLYKDMRRGAARLIMLRLQAQSKNLKLDDSGNGQ